MDVVNVLLSACSYQDCSCTYIELHSFIRSILTMLVLEGEARRGELMHPSLSASPVKISREQIEGPHNHAQPIHRSMLSYPCRCIMHLISAEMTHSPSKTPLRRLWNAAANPRTPPISCSLIEQQHYSKPAS